MTELPVAVELDLDRRVNYALQQNDVPVVAWLGLRHAGERPLDDLRVEVTLGDDLASPWVAELAALPAGGGASAAAGGAKKKARKPPPAT